MPRDAAKATLNRDKATRLKAEWGVDAAQVRYREIGNWYATLTRFPAALFDAHGYMLFATEEDYRTSPHLQIGKEISVPKGISTMPGYVRVVASDDEQGSEAENYDDPDHEERSTIIIFSAKIQSNAHRLFQDWREANPTGYFINCKGPNNSLLHDASCSHLGDTNWDGEEHNTLAANPKVCARTTNELRIWAVEHQLTIGECKDCKRRGLDDKSPDILFPKEYAARLEKIVDNAIYVAEERAAESGTPERIETTIRRIIRDSAIVRTVKRLHDFRCQVCGYRIELADGNFYAEAHHIRPLGSKHDGPDTMDNLLCVCPNHHVELDYLITPLRISEIRSKPEHRISQEHLDYHNKLMEDAIGL